MSKAPHNEHMLELAIVRRAGNDNERALADRMTMANAEETLSLFRDLGFPDPEPVYAMKLDHQVAQKLRGVCCKGSERAHDLIDLQLILEREQIYLPRVKTICNNIFRGNGCPPWPTKVAKGPKWDAIYDAQKLSLPVLSTVDEAVDWVNQLIDRIEQS